MIIHEKIAQPGDIVALHAPHVGRYGKVVQGFAKRIELRLDSGAGINVHRDDATVVYKEQLT